jgi:2-dehydropantoate 2-reductase
VRVPQGALGEDFAALTGESSLEVEVVDDFVTALWSKLVLNLVSNSLTTLVDVPVRDVARLPGLRRIADELVVECCRVGRLVGADLVDDRFRRMVDAFAEFPEALHSSMWQDRQAGRPFEHDAISGVVVREGARLGVDVPVARTVTALLDALSPPVR